MTILSLPYTHKKQLSSETTFVKIQLSVEKPKESLRKAGLFFFKVSDSKGKSLKLDDKFIISKRYGPYFYVNLIKNQEYYTVDVPIPADAVMIEVGVAGMVATADSFTKNAVVSLFEHGPETDTDFSRVSDNNPIAVDGVRVSYDVQAGVKYELSWQTGEETSGKGLFLFSFRSSDGEELLPTGQFPIHQELGSYKYMGEGVSDSVAFTVPERATELILSGRQWSGETVHLLAKPVVSNVDDASISGATITSNWMSRLKNDENVLIIHSTAGAISRTNKLLLRSNRTALEMSHRGWKVIYVPFGAPEDADRLVSDYLIQIAGTELVGVIDHLVTRELTGKRVFLCSSHSDMAAVAVQNRLQDYGWKTVYEIRDDMEEFRRVGYSKWYSPALELRYATEADAIIATSPRLLAKIATVTGRDDIAYLPNAAPDELIADTAIMRTTVHAEEHRQKPVVGYLGHLTGSWFDWQKFIQLVKENPRINFEVIGHGIPESIRLPLNVKYFGPMGHEECMPIVSKWTVGLIPFIESRLTYGVDPNKVYEYIAMGLQTVSSPMGDLENVPGVHLYRSSQEFNQSLLKAISVRPNEEFYNECDTFLRTASWKYRVEEISEFLEGMYK